MTWGVALIGAGRAGGHRAAAVAADEGSRLVAVCDVDEAAARALAAEHGADWHSDWQSLVAGDDADLVVVSTPHDGLAEIAAAALRGGRHVLCEKPLGRDLKEVEGVVAAAREGGRVLRAGYNHRFHPAVEGVRLAVEEGGLGPLMFARGRYGHGGRPGYDREWRSDPAVSGGGELLDQGAHLVDLFLWIFATDFDLVSAEAVTAFWDMPVEDNAFALLRAPGGQVASLHVSWTQWRNLFSLEVFGREGFAIAEGLGGSYGEERLVIGHRRPEGGAPRERVRRFRGPDRSWAREWMAFVAAVEGRPSPGADGEAALRTMGHLRRIYDAAGRGRSTLNFNKNN